MTPPIRVRRELVDGKRWWTVRFDGRITGRFYTGDLALAAVHRDLALAETVKGTRGQLGHRLARAIPVSEAAR